ncbi:MAG TPA: hypothetical protein VHZ32_00775 [Rhizomicrobium sp.]|jgi:hypothetical protein|nr:hypothetical protein [Rhizomicrobium sp.]
MRALPLIVAGLLAASAAFGAEGEKADGKKGAPGNNVELPYLMAPMNDADGKLSGYAYISSLLVAAGPTEALAVRDKLAFLQDSFVRDVNGAAVATADDLDKVDIAALQNRLLTDARHIVGAAKVKAILVCTVQVAELHPKQTPDLYTPDKASIQQAEKGGKPAKKSPCDA